MAAILGGASISMNTDLVIFDCDGVLVDSEVIAYRVFAECLNQAGIMLSVDEAMAFGVDKSAPILGAAVEKKVWSLIAREFRGNVSGAGHGCLHTGT
jgi:beta-phosphoglucomutase-like phosphatase (HAD superfamily)